MSALERALSLINAADPAGELPKCEIREIVIKTNAIESILEVVSRYVNEGSSIGLIVDETPILRNGEEVKPLIKKTLEEKFQVTLIVLDDGFPELHASEGVIAESIKLSEKLTCLVTIGGGTITDIGKMTSVGLGGIPHVAIQTAASVDGYTDNVSVILVNGVKRTVPSRWPEALIADSTLIAQAPMTMNRAGYGEINSMFTAPADWRLAALLNFEPKFHWAPIELLRGVGEGIEEWAPGLRESNLDSIEKLVNALAIRGIVTGVADTTACLSGIEHLVSHMLDMYQGAKKLTIGQHGAQVGVGSVYAASVWEYIFFKVDAQSGDLIKNLDRDYLKTKVFNAFSDLDPTLALAQECWKDYERKIDFWETNFANVITILKNWDLVKGELRNLIKTPEDIVSGLVSSGTPISFVNLEPKISEEIGAWAVSNCHLMRNRFVGIDFLEFLGLWKTPDIKWVSNRVKKAIDSNSVQI
jgi:glycerol-1-phosphate dehydrogenase [NAD(P)+]